MTVQFRCERELEALALTRRLNAPLRFDQFIERVLALPRRHRTGANTPKLHLTPLTQRRRPPRR